jgi:sugar phosphate isomerase/epimerase
MTVSLCSISFRHEMVSFSDLVRYTAETGFDAIELWGVHARSILRQHRQQPDRALEEMHECGLFVSMISDYVDLRLAHEDPVDVLDQWKSRMELASDSGPIGSAYSLAIALARQSASRSGDDASAGSGQWRTALRQKGCTSCWRRTRIR